MIIHKSTSGPLRERFDKDNIEKIIKESGKIGIFTYFNNLKKEGFIDKFSYAHGTNIWIKFTSKSTGKGKIRI